MDSLSVVGMVLAVLEVAGNLFKELKSIDDTVSELQSRIEELESIVDTVSESQSRIEELKSIVDTTVIATQQDDEWSSLRRIRALRRGACNLEHETVIQMLREKTMNIAKEYTGKIAFSIEGAFYNNAILIYNWKIDTDGLFNVIKALSRTDAIVRHDGFRGPDILIGYHQDLKPSNILVLSGKSSGMEFKIADLGPSQFKQAIELDPRGHNWRFSGRGRFSWGPPVRWIPQSIAQRYSCTIQHDVSRELNWYDDLCDGNVMPVSTPYTTDAIDAGRTCLTLRNYLLRDKCCERPKAHLSMLLAPARRIWRNIMDLLSYQHQKLALPILMLCVKPARAKSCESSEQRQGLTRAPHSSMSRHLHLLLDTARKVLRLWENPQERSTQNSPTPQTLLLGCFLCTSLAVIVAYIHRNDRYQAYFLIISSMLCVGGGAFFAADVQDFVFRYLLLGVSVGLGLSALFHRGMAVRRNRSRGRLAQEKSSLAPRDEK